MLYTVFLQNRFLQGLKGALVQQKTANLKSSSKTITKHVIELTYIVTMIQKSGILQTWNIRVESSFSHHSNITLSLMKYPEW